MIWTDNSPKILNAIFKKKRLPCFGTHEKFCLDFVSKGKTINAGHEKLKEIEKNKFGLRGKATTLGNFETATWRCNAIFDKKNQVLAYWKISRDFFLLDSLKKLWVQFIFKTRRGSQLFQVVRWKLLFKKKFLINQFGCSTVYLRGNVFKLVRRWEKRMHLKGVKYIRFDRVKAINPFFINRYISVPYLWNRLVQKGNRRF